VYSLVVLVAVSLVLALGATPVFRNLFRRWGVVDRPDGKRKPHPAPTPRLGGVPIMTACLGAFGLLALLPMRGGEITREAIPSFLALLPAAIVVFLTGIWDDVRGLSPRQKLVGEVAAAGLAVLGGVQMTNLAGFTLPGWLSVAATVLWLVGCANAVNLIDGMDGLAAGIALLAAATMLLAALLQHSTALAFATAPLVGALLGFLPYNSNPASIFLGDSGSLTLGFLLGCYAILWSQKSTTIFSLTAPLLVLAVPLADTALAVARRFLRQKPIFAADRGHIHHRLLAKGLTPHRAVLLLYAAAGACAVVSLVVGVAHGRLAGPVLIVFVVGAIYGIHALGYVEFGTARRLALAGAFRRLLNAQISLDTVARQLRAASTLGECWRHLEAAYPSFGFASIELEVDGTRMVHPPEADLSRTAWVLNVNLKNGNHLLLRRDAGMGNHTTLAAAFAEMLQKELPAKLETPRAKAATA